MEYVQERIATLHDLTDPLPEAPTDQTAVIVPMTDNEYGTLAAERVLTALETVDPAQVLVPLRASRETVEACHEWLAEFDLSLDVLWCASDEVTALLADYGLDGDAGKGRDVWLALGVAAANHRYVVCHDADTKTYSPAFVRRLLAPLARDWAFSKGYYARVENGRLYGRLFRLFYAPVVRALRAQHDEPVVEYLAAFRYALAGEFAMTSDLARRLRIERRWGLEVGTLGSAFDEVGFAGTAQVDLGVCEHNHRAVTGPRGLATMVDDVSAALFRVVEENGVVPDYAALTRGYRDATDEFIRQYAADAAFNDLSYDSADEREQIDAYVDAIGPPGRDTRLPAWSEIDLDPETVRAAARIDGEKTDAYTTEN